MSADTPKSLGPALERLIQEDLEKALPITDASRIWYVDHKKVIANFSQYAHLGNLKKAIGKNPVLSADLGVDYLIRPDVTVGVTQDPLPQMLVHFCTRPSHASGQSGPTGYRISGTSFYT
ncbi:NgoMIV family type II restriction endonuclease [Streptomyces coeruleorubidus]|uniref:NgoMIV family type II restriction endonuclease n=1 Tax=Streptomyces coeruleorubidus TaxID=116188 RepID=UPI00381918F8